MNNKNIFYPLLILSMIFWGIAWVNTKILTAYVNEYELVFLRMGICFISMFPIIYFSNLSFKINLKSFYLILISSVFLVLYSIVFFLGVQHGTPGCVTRTVTKPGYRKIQGGRILQRTGNRIH